ncbi:MAG: 50S ribosomal protein L11 methyltransferase [Flavobacteriia bacterium]|nr:50S ribosomal protein L11 methyltransferase [Flavobacteriia bacterium]OIP48500.1 MAG: ribosomal protein L11 methyltransferase [Flavobacteriaceae bacterium CG2_30_31_66]PIV97319.1 MAG: 50S ribosomal protein L11 methyltransferase [Flavobacteriaceae bacterium CG17_big_fil_post_rev_8_21_14_2_50_31_13]PIY15004.1 MAG: 50S ribosomal protein L11 methyltransferase [Flavobacteriaceae bacterium CG_4_10_14_3_um_filter_31_253]PIZ09633.1 MAG: 50S ribosomal protein L11 methyltransferase [Flavobacteriaceae 
MDNIYIEYNFRISPREPASEILIAELGEVGFESFVENEIGLLAYIQKADWFENILDDIFILNSDEFEIEYEHNEIPQTNWNEEWEKNFEPIQVDDLVSIRAPFHENPHLKYEIIIEPKMSFGTGHHETTHMMIQHLLELDLENKKVLDMGCGTGILAIFAEIKGAKPIDAIDIDEWCYTNSIENVERNHCHQISVYQGDASLLTTQKYDVILANINRNILLADMDAYAKCLEKNGILLLSGFYEEDLTLIDVEAKKHQLKLQKMIKRNLWISANYLKQ